MTWVPSARTMWASNTPAESVSTRSIVAVGALALAAAVTFAATTPVRSFSSERMGLLGSAAAPDPVDGGYDDVAVDDVTWSALARDAPVMAMPVASARPAATGTMVIF